MTVIAAIQMASTKDVERNVELACHGIEEAASAGAKLVVLPEEFISLLLTLEEKLQIAEPYLEGPIQQALAHAAKKNNIWLVGGTLPLQTPSKKKVYSSSLVWNNKGDCVARYNKIHLFDVTVEQGESYCESERVLGGDAVCVLDTPFGKMGVAICYDLRFPELFRLMMLNGVEIMVLPSAFTENTGKAHWEVLLRARAIENQCYVVAPDQVAMRLSGHKTFGHSMIIGPWGNILASATDKPAMITAEIDIEKLKTIRKQFPAVSHYRPFLMKELAKKSEEVN
ncbi:MAG: carbon-nitrogen hydrolase family protein [Candidatus Berkiella sp.]